MNQMDRPESPVTSFTTTIIHNNLSQAQSILAGNLIISHSNGQHKINNSNEQQQLNKYRICRDFVRGSCRRLYCKYPHVQSSDLVVFCHDFQNNKCPRINCKFLHYTIDEEEHYRKFGEFLINQGSNSNGGDNNNDFGNNKNLNNVGGKNYVDNLGDYSEYSFFNNSNSSNGNRSLPSLLDSDLFHPCQQQRIEGGCTGHCHNNDRAFSNGSSGFRNGLKRLNNGQDREFLQQAPNFKRCREDELMTVLRRFEEEHLMLKRRVEANELKIAELRASNEYLMTQNAQLRISTVQVSRVVNPVTVTHTQSQQSTPAPQVINATMAPIVSMATPTQIITSPPNASSINSINVGTPIAIHTTNTSQQQLLGTSQITLAGLSTPAGLSAPSIGLSINTSQALQAAISNATQPIISYPIMTHSILPH